MADDTHSSSPTDRTHRYEQLALDALRQHVSMSIRDLAERIVAEEYGPLTDVPGERVDAVERALRRRHVPELEERSYVRYDSERGIVNLLGRGSDAVVEVAADPAHTVELEADEPTTVSVELSERTLQRLHESMRRDDRLDAEMSYDEVVRRLAED
jgi:hypothetical protein